MSLTPFDQHYIETYNKTHDTSNSPPLAHAEYYRSLSRRDAERLAPVIHDPVSGITVRIVPAHQIEGGIGK